MKALILQNYNSLAYGDAPMPNVRDQDVLVRVRACGICGSDVHGMDGSTGRRIPPLIMGHEAAGEICEIGSQVSDWKSGDRVTFDSTVWCGECWQCNRGDLNLCDNRRVLGVSCSEYRLDGAFAEYVAIPARILYRLPERLGFESAAMVEAVAVAIHAVKRKPPEPHSTIAIIGMGMIGLLITQVLKAAGYDRIIAIDVDDQRLQWALRLGATDLVPASNIDVGAAVERLTWGRGADAVFEAAGNEASFSSAVESARKGASVTLVGNLESSVRLPLQSIVTRQISLFGSCASAGEYPASLSLIASGKINVQDFISSAPPLVEGATWMSRLQAREPGLMKVILRP